MITYQTTLEGVSEEGLEGFFDGWQDRPTSATLLRLLGRTDHMVLARDSDGQIVGLATALSDGVLCAYISLLEVRESHRRQGIGAELVRRLLSEVGELYMVDLICDPGLLGFYSGLGFTPATGASIRRYAQQAGRRP